MRLSGHINNPKTAPAYSAEVALATKAGSKITPFSSPPPAKKALFRMHDLMTNKQAAPAPMPVAKSAPVTEHAPAPKPAPVPMTEHALAPAPLPAGMDFVIGQLRGGGGPAAPRAGISTGRSVATERDGHLMTEALLDSPGPKENVADAAPARSATHSVAGRPAKASAALEKTANASHYKGPSAGIYDICRQLGIAVPADRTVVLERARACLVTVFKKILLPAAERHMIWPTIKSIASDLDGIIAADATVLSILHRYRATEEKLVWHSLYTAILAMDLARHVENLDSSVYEIGGAALLHDAGFLIQTVNGFDTNGFDNITERNAPESREHVGKSVELVRRIEVPDAVVTMIAQHLGRVDGQGFPPGLAHGTFPRCSQILAIACIFEHTILDLAMERKEAASGNAGENDETGETGGNGIVKTLGKYHKAFDIDLLKKMLALVGIYPVGSMIELNNRAICKVVKQNNDFPLRPVVQVIMDGAGMHPEQEKLIDLQEIRVLSIIRTLANFELKTEP